MVLAASAAAPLAAQSGSRGSLSLMAGATNYDLSGTGTVPVAHLALAVRPARAIVIEPSIGHFAYTSQGYDMDPDRWVVAEVAVQLQAPNGKVHPFVGVGAGTGWLLPARWELSLQASGGVRVDLGPDWGVRGELRVHSIDPFHGSAADVLVGVSRRVW
jgi:hypothetical protein